MAKVCECCAKGPSTGHNVSHSNRRTKRRFLPNLKKKIIFDPHTGIKRLLKLCTRCLRTLAKQANV